MGLSKTEAKKQLIEGVMLLKPIKMEDLASVFIGCIWYHRVGYTYSILQTRASSMAPIVLRLALHLASTISLHKSYLGAALYHRIGKYLSQPSYLAAQGLG